MTILPNQLYSLHYCSFISSFWKSSSHGILTSLGPEHLLADVKAPNEFYHIYFFPKDGAFHVNRPSPKFVSAANSSSSADGAVAPMTGTIVKVSNLLRGISRASGAWISTKDFQII